MCPQSDDPAYGSLRPATNRVPGPAHTTVVPSPIDHTTRTGTAVTVADNPGTVAVAGRGPHIPGSSHSHVGTRTSCATPGPGDIPITGVASTSTRYARCANTAADGPPAGTGTAAGFNQKNPADTPPQVTEYRCASGGGAPYPTARIDGSNPDSQV